VDLFLVIPPNATTPQISRALTSTQDQWFVTTFPGAAIFEITDFEFAAENPTVVGASTGAGAGKVKFDQLVIHKSVDQGSPALFTISASGEHFPVVQLYIRNASGPAGATPLPFLGYEFQTVFITNIDWSAGNGSSQPVEAVTFAFGAMVIAYKPTNPDGTLGQASRSGWSTITNAGNVQDTLDVK
jgi:type VI secretion system secreted protein Hcp